MARTNGARKRQETIQSTHRPRELAWIETHVDQMRRLAGEWVVVAGEELIAHGKSAARLVAAGRRVATWRAAPEIPGLAAR